MTFKRIRYVAVFLALAWLPACGDSFDDAIARAESGAVTMDRRERQTVIDALRKGLEEQDELSAAAKGRATAWLGHLLVRHGQFEAAQTVLSDFGATADHLVAAGDPVSAVRGLGALGASLSSLGRDYDVGEPLRRAVTIAVQKSLMSDPVVIEALLESAFLVLILRHGEKGPGTLAEAMAVAERLLDSAEEVVLAHGGQGDPRFGHIYFLQAVMRDLAAHELGLSDLARGNLLQERTALLELSRAHLGRDDPVQVPALEMLAQAHAAACDSKTMERRSRDAVEVAEEIYGDTAERTFRVRSVYGELLMAMGDVTRGRQIILDARAVRYGEAADELQEPATRYDPLGCIDPPQ